jgi:hypothetical protein
VSDAFWKEGFMSKINLGNFERIEIYQTRSVQKAHGIRLVHGIGIALLLLLAIAAAVSAHPQAAEPYQRELSFFLSP